MNVINNKYVHISAYMFHFHAVINDLNDELGVVCFKEFRIFVSQIKMIYLQENVPSILMNTI